MRRPHSAAPAVVMATAAIAALGVIVGIAEAQPDELASQVFIVLLAASFTSVGALVLARIPGHAVGRLCLAIGALWAVCATSITLGEVTHRAGWGGAADWLAWPGWLWIVAVGLIGTHLLLRLPDGRLHSPRWRRFARACTAAIVLGSVAMALTPAQGSSVENPLGVEGADALLVVALLLIGACILGSIGEFVVRYRRGDPATRVRLRWVAAGATAVVAIDAVLVALLTSGVVGNDTALGTALANVRIVLYTVIPVCIGVAILRHRLLGIDVAINRALVYGSVTALLLGAYVVLVLALQGALGPVTDGNGVAVALSTLAAAALFRPVRRRVQGAVDRRFYRHRYDAERTLTRFAARLRVETDLDALRRELAAAVREAVQPAHVSVWLREPRP